MALAGPDEGCPASWVACLDLAAARALERRLQAERRWREEVKALCEEEAPAP